MQPMVSRRRVLTGLSMTSTAGLIRAPLALAGEGPPETTSGFYSLRLHDLGFVKSVPQKVIANGTDWRFLNELKRELKA